MAHRLTEHFAHLLHAPAVTTAAGLVAGIVLAAALLLALGARPANGLRRAPS